MIQRYTITSRFGIQATEGDDGTWVRHDDHLADKAAALERMRDENADTQNMLDAIYAKGLEHHEHVAQLVEVVKHCDEEPDKHGMCMCAHAIAEALAAKDEESKRLRSELSQAQADRDSLMRHREEVEKPIKDLTREVAALQKESDGLHIQFDTEHEKLIESERRNKLLRVNAERLKAERLGAVRQCYEFADHLCQYDNDRWEAPRIQWKNLLSLLGK